MKYPLLFLAIGLSLLSQHTSSTCPDRKMCTKTNTCCQSGSTYGCCPFEDGVCCSDQLSCCPKGYKCNLEAGRCTNSETPLNDLILADLTVSRPHKRDDFLQLLSEEELQNKIVLIANESPCSNPVECYLKAISEMKSIKSDIIEMLKNRDAQIDEKMKSIESSLNEMRVVQANIDDQIKKISQKEDSDTKIMTEQISQIKSDLNTVTKNKVKLVSIPASNWEYTSTNTPFTIIDYSFSLDTNSAVEASLVAHGFVKNDCANDVLISFDNENFGSNLPFGFGVTHSQSWVNIVAQTSKELGVGNHNVKIIIRTRNPCVAQLAGPLLNLRFYPK